MALTIAADRVSNDWIMVDTVKQRTPRGRVGHSATVMRDRRVIA